MGLCELPSEFRVSHFGGGERPVRKPNFEISNRRRFDEYLRRHENSVVLFGDGLHVDTHPRKNGLSELSWHVRKLPFKRLAQFHDVFAYLDDIGCLYAFAVLFEEWVCKNGYPFRFAGSTSTNHNWVGRDCQKYVPGLYWMNYFSDSYAEQHTIDTSRLGTDLRIEPVRLSRGWLLKLYDHPCDWAQHLPHVDAVTLNTPGFFSMRRVDLPEVVEPQKITEFIAESNLKWP